MRQSGWGKEKVMVPRADASGRGSRILLAEDRASTRECIAWQLRRDGWNVVEADDGMALLGHIERVAAEGEGPESFVVIAGSHLPGLTGMDILTVLRCAYWQTPVILVTAVRDDETRAEATGLGAVAVFDPPLDLDALRSAVSRAAAGGAGAGVR
jgi:two-component system, NtrC family, response regulator AtoC